MGTNGRIFNGGSTQHHVSINLSVMLEVVTLMWDVKHMEAMIRGKKGYYIEPSSITEVRRASLA